MIVRKAANLIHQLKKPILGVVENMSYFVAPDTGIRYDVFGPSYADRVAELAGAPMLARMPIDPYLVRTGRRRTGRGDRRSDRRRARGRTRARGRRVAERQRNDLDHLSDRSRLARLALGVAPASRSGTPRSATYEARNDSQRAGACPGARSETLRRSAPLADGRSASRVRSPRPASGRSVSPIPPSARCVAFRPPSNCRCSSRS